MRLETSLQLLERVRATHNVSWYRLARMIPTSESTIANWKNGRTGIDQRFVTRIAELLEEPPEYVLACIEAERAQSPELVKIWRGIAEKFRTHAASILLVGLALLGVGNAGKAEAARHSPTGSAGAPMYIKSNRRRTRPKGFFGLVPA
jgi:transcriptional regulator with XRE-family HTH domain